MRTRTIDLALAATVVLAATACSDGTGPANGRDVGLTFQVAQSAAAGAGGDGGSGTIAERGLALSVPTVVATNAGLLITNDADEILLTRAQLVVKDVKLKRAALECSDDSDFRTVNFVEVDGEIVTIVVNANVERDRASCPTVHLGPYLVDVPMTGGDGPRLTVGIPEGTYSSVRFSLHKVTSNKPDDAAFRQTYPDMRDISARLEGTYNGVPFVFITDINAKLNIPLPAPVAIGEGGADVTVAVDFGAWFARSQGGLYSPALANTPGSTRSAVRNNIRVAFRAFRDRNHDGRAD